MGNEKKKGSAEASANPTQEKYNKLRERTQAETHVRDLVEKDGKRYGVYSIDWGCFDV